jgi:hypothetical protein
LLSKKHYDEDNQRGRACVSKRARTAYLSRSCSVHAVRFALSGEVLAVPWPDIYQVTSRGFEPFHPRLGVLLADPGSVLI